jgi:hypothetical protein
MVLLKNYSINGTELGGNNGRINNHTTKKRSLKFNIKDK